MSEIRVKDGNVEDAIKRFKRQCARNGVMQEVRKTANNLFIIKLSLIDCNIIVIY